MRLVQAQLPTSLVPAALSAAAMMILVPLVDVVATVGSFDPEVLRWRYGVVGVLSGALLTPTLGLSLALVTGCVFERKWLVRSVAVLSGLGAVLLLGLLAMYALDALQLRAEIRPEFWRPLYLSAARTTVNFGIVASVLLVQSIVGFRFGRRVSQSKAAQPSEAERILVARGA